MSLTEQEARERLIAAGAEVVEDWQVQIAMRVAAGVTDDDPIRDTRIASSAVQNP